MAWDILKKAFGKKEEKPTAAASVKPEAGAAVVKEKDSKRKKNEYTEEQLEAELAKLPAPLRSQLNNPEIKKKIVVLAKRMAEDGVDLKSMRQVRSWIKNHPEAAQQQEGAAKIETFRREEPKVGRNDVCPCGSGKKYKKCCGGK